LKYFWTRQVSLLKRLRVRIKFIKKAATRNLLSDSGPTIPNDPPENI